MKTSIETFALAAMVSIILLACDDIIVNNTELGGSILSSSDTQPSNSSGGIEFPAMDKRVVSYHRTITRDEYTIQQLGDQWYGHGFITDKEILKLWFPHIFDNERAESECNYFALHFTNSSSGLVQSYEVLSQDMVLYQIACTWREPPGITTGDFAKRAMLICDDKGWKLKESIDLYSIRFYNDPNWECESSTGSPNWEEIYF